VKQIRTASKTELQKRERAVCALIEKKTVKEAAKVVGVSTKTLARWMKEESFEHLYKETVSEVFKVATRRLRGMVGRMVGTLETVAVGKKTPAAARVSAALGALRVAQDAEILEGIEAEISKMERERDEEIPGAYPAT
jgi:transcriptional regulator with XRE-family HTH domain